MAECATDRRAVLPCDTRSQAGEAARLSPRLMCWRPRRQLYKVPTPACDMMGRKDDGQESGLSMCLLDAHCTLLSQLGAVERTQVNIRERLYCLLEVLARANPFLEIFERLAAFCCSHMRAYLIERPMGRPSRQGSPRHRKCCHLCISKPSSNADMSEEEGARTLHRIRLRSSWREYLHHTRRQTHHVRQVGDHANDKLACVRRELRRSPIRRYRLLDFFQWRAVHPLSQSRLKLGNPRTSLSLHPMPGLHRSSQRDLRRSRA